MATPTNLPASFVSGNTLTATQMNDLRGAFRILQVVNATYATGVNSASATYVDTGLTASITPQATTSKIAILLVHRMFADGGTGANVRLMRGATQIQTATNVCYSAGGANIQYYKMLWLDSPSTTSSTTYKTQFNRSIGGGTVTMQPDAQDSSIFLLEVSA